MKAPLACRPAGTVSAEVTSPLPMSSANARYTVARTSGCAASNIFEQLPVLLDLGAVLGLFGTHAFDDFGWRFTQKLLVCELPRLAVGGLLQCRVFLLNASPRFRSALGLLRRGMDL